MAAKIEDRVRPVSAPELLRTRPAGPGSGVMPRASRRPGLLPRLLQAPTFLLAMVVPNLASVGYYGIVASPVFVSNASVMVTNPTRDSDGITSLLAGNSGSSVGGASVLKEYVSSWDAFESLRSTIDLEAAYEAGDLLSRYGGLPTWWHRNDVALWRYYRSHVTVDVDQKTGIATISALGYDPVLAHRIARTVIADAIAHMNAMNRSEARDFVASATAHAEALRAAIAVDEAAIAAYRLGSAVFEPGTDYADSLSAARDMAEKRAGLLAQRDAIAKDTPHNPVASSYGIEAESLARDMQTDRAAAARVAATATAFDRLTMRRDLDVQLLQQAEIAVQQAEIKASQNHYYIETVSAPSQPVSPELPDRIVRVFEVLLVSIVAWTLIR